MRCLSICLAAAILAALAGAVRAEDAKPGNLPLTRVVLFSSGVGFFEHAGQVHDDAKVELKFKADEINDLLEEHGRAGP